MTDSPRAADPLAAPGTGERVRLDVGEVAQLVEFVREAPGRLSVALVPGPVVTAELVRRIRAAGMDVATLALAPPRRLADSLTAFRNRDTVVTIEGLDAYQRSRRTVTPRPSGAS